MMYNVGLVAVPPVHLFPNNSVSSICDRYLLGSLMSSFSIIIYRFILSPAEPEAGA